MRYLDEGTLLSSYDWCLPYQLTPESIPTAAATTVCAWSPALLNGFTG